MLGNAQGFTVDFISGASEISASGLSNEKTGFLIAICFASAAVRLITKIRDLFAVDWAPAEQSGSGHLADGKEP
jgi:hypothetical protein